MIRTTTLLATAALALAGCASAPYEIPGEVATTCRGYASGMSVAQIAEVRGRVLTEIERPESPSESLVYVARLIDEHCPVR